MIDFLIIGGFIGALVYFVKWGTSLKMDKRKNIIYGNGKSGEYFIIMVACILISALAMCQL